MREEEMSLTPKFWICIRTHFVYNFAVFWYIILDTNHRIQEEVWVIVVFIQHLHLNPLTHTHPSIHLHLHQHPNPPTLTPTYIHPHPPTSTHPSIRKHLHTHPNPHTHRHTHSPLSDTVLVAAVFSHVSLPWKKLRSFASQYIN
jgi:hypothetical protein